MTQATTGSWWPIKVLYWILLLMSLLAVPVLPGLVMAVAGVMYSAGIAAFIVAAIVGYVVLLWACHFAHADTRALFGIGGWRRTVTEDDRDVSPGRVRARASPERRPVRSEHHSGSVSRGHPANEPRAGEPRPGSRVGCAGLE